MYLMLSETNKTWQPVHNGVYSLVAKAKDPHMKMKSLVLSNI